MGSSVPVRCDTVGVFFSVPNIDAAFFQKFVYTLANDNEESPVLYDIVIAPKDKEHEDSSNSPKHEPLYRTIKRPNSQFRSRMLDSAEESSKTRLLSWTRFLI